MTENNFFSSAIKAGPVALKPKPEEVLPPVSQENSAQEDTQEIKHDNAEIIQPKNEKKPGLFDRVANALKGANIKEALFKERHLVTHNENDSKALKRAKNLLEAGGAIGKSIAETAARVTGTKAAFDLPLWALQSYEIAQNRKEMKSLIKGEGSVVDKKEQIQGLLNKASLAKKLSPKELAEFHSTLEKISEGHEDGGERDKKYEALVDKYLMTKTSGIQVAREAVNSAFVLSGAGLAHAGAALSGGALMRGMSMFGFKALEAFTEAENESGRKELGGTKESSMEIFKKKLVDSARNTLSLGLSSENQKRTRTEKIIDSTKAVGTLLTFFGIGNAAVGVAHAEVAQVVVEKLHYDGFHDVGENFVANAMKMWNIYSHPLEAMQNMKRGISASIGKFMSGETPVHAGASSIGERDGVNYESGASHAGKDGERLVSGASIGGAAAARGILADSGPRDYVSATSGEQEIMDKYNKFSNAQGEVINKARGLAGKAVDGFYGLGKPAMSEMAAMGPSGMSHHEAAKAARGILEGTGTEDYVSATSGEQEIMDKYNKFSNAQGEVINKARGLAGKAVDGIYDLGKPAMSEMAMGPSGMSHHEAAKAARGILADSGPRDYVSATSGEQEIMDKYNKFSNAQGEVINKARGLAGKAVDGIYDLGKPAMSEMAMGPSGMSRRNYAEELAQKAADKFVGAHQKAADMVQSGARRAAETLGMSAPDRDYDLGEDVVTGEKNPVKHPHYDKIREALRTGPRPVIEAVDERTGPVEPGADRVVSVDEPHRSVAGQRVQSELGKATEKIDDLLNNEAKPSKMAQDLAAAEESRLAKAAAEETVNPEKAIKSSAGAINKGAKTLREQLEEIDRRGRELQGPDEAELAQASKDAAEMQTILKGPELGNEDIVSPFAKYQAEQQQLLSNELSPYGLIVKSSENGNSLSFKPTKELLQKFAEQGSDSDLVKQAYQVGVLEHEYNEMPDGSARSSVLAMKNQMQEKMNKMLEKASDGTAKTKMKRLIALVARDPAKF